MPGFEADKFTSNIMNCPWAIQITKKNIISPYLVLSFLKIQKTTLGSCVFFGSQVPGGCFPFSFLKFQVITLSPSFRPNVGKSTHSVLSANAWNLKEEEILNIRIVVLFVHVYSFSQDRDLALLWCRES